MEEVRIGPHRLIRGDCLEVLAGLGKVDAVVQSAVGQVLADLCEAVHAFDCDWLLLSGRPSRLRAVQDIIRAIPKLKRADFSENGKPKLPALKQVIAPEALVGEARLDESSVPPPGA